MPEYLPQGTTIDFLSIDCEGQDIKVLRGNNWDIYKPNIIAIEDYDDRDRQIELKELRISPVKDFLYDKGYMFVASVVHTKMFASKSFKQQLSNDFCIAK